jgi:uncharacterized membrane protein YtjA (UPF0391 family)
MQCAFHAIRHRRNLRLSRPMVSSVHPCRVAAADSIDQGGTPERRSPMLNWALAFLLIAIIAAVFGFTGIAVASAGIAKILFFVFLVVFLVVLIMGVARRA